MTITTQKNSFPCHSTFSKFASLKCSLMFAYVTVSNIEVREFFTSLISRIIWTTRQLGRPPAQHIRSLVKAASFPSLFLFCQQLFLNQQDRLLLLPLLLSGSQSFCLFHLSLISASSQNSSSPQSGVSRPNNDTQEMAQTFAATGIKNELCKRLELPFSPVSVKGKI